MGSTASASCHAFVHAGRQVDQRGRDGTQYAAGRLHTVGDAYLARCERHAGGLLAFARRFLIGHASRVCAAAESGVTPGATSRVWLCWPAIKVSKGVGGRGLRRCNCCGVDASCFKMQVACRLSGRDSTQAKSCGRRDFRPSLVFANAMFIAATVQLIALQNKGWPSYSSHLANFVAQSTTVCDTSLLHRPMAI